MTRSQVRRSHHRQALLVVVAVLSACSPANMESPAASGAAPTPSAGGGITAATPPAVLPPLADVTAYKASNWRNGIQPGPGPVAKPVEVWVTELGCAVAERTGVLGSGLYLIGCDANRLTAIDARTGAIAWTADIDGQVLGSAAIDGDHAYIADSSGTITKLDLATGDRVWSASVGAKGIAVADGAAYAATQGNSVVGLGLADGAQTWSWTAPAPARHVSVVDGTAYVGVDDGAMHAVSLADGSTSWRIATASGGVTTPSIDGGLLYFGALESGESKGELVAVNRTEGTERWRHGTAAGSQISPVIAADGIVYAVSGGEGLFALGGDDPSSPVLGQQPTAPASYFPAALAGDVIYLTGDRSLSAYAKSDLAKLWQIDLAAHARSGPVVSGGLVILGDDAGNVHAFAEPAIARLLESAGMPPPTSPGPTADHSRLAALTLEATFNGAAIGFDHPSGVDVGPDGLLYVVSCGTSEVVVIDPGGAVVRRWGSKGSGEGQFDCRREVTDPASDISGVGVGRDGTVYVADTVNRRVQAFEPDGTFIREWGRFGNGNGQFLDPVDIAVGTDGLVHVVDDQRDDIQVFDGTGRFVRVIGSHGTAPGQLNFTSGIDVGDDGTVYNADFGNNRAQAWDVRGALLWTLARRGTADGELDEPRDIASGTDGTFHVVDRRRVQTFHENGDVIGSWSTPGLDLFGVTAGDGVVYAAGPWDDQIYRLVVQP